MLNIYFMIFMTVVSYFYMNFLAVLVDFLLLPIFYMDYAVVGMIRAFFFGVETWMKRDWRG